MLLTCVLAVHDLAACHPRLLAAVVPNPAPVAPPGLSGRVSTLLAWWKWGALIAGVFGLIGCGQPSLTTTRTVTRARGGVSAATAAVAAVAAAAVLRQATSRGRPWAMIAGERGSRAGRIAPMSHAGDSSWARVVVPAPPCAPQITSSCRCAACCRSQLSRSPARPLAAGLKDVIAVIGCTGQAGRAVWLGSVTGSAGTPSNSSSPAVGIR